MHISAVDSYRHFMKLITYINLLESI